jgi:hypothetical protein
VFHWEDFHWQVEYNLYGMGFVRFRKARFRGPLPMRGMTTRAGWDAVPEVISYEEASTGGLLFVLLWLCFELSSHLL